MQGWGACSSRCVQGVPVSPSPRTWVAPQQVTHSAVMRHLLLAINGSDLQQQQQQQHASGTNQWQQKSGAAKAPAVALQQPLLSAPGVNCVPLLPSHLVQCVDGW